MCCCCTAGPRPGGQELYLGNTINDSLRPQAAAAPLTVCVCVCGPFFRIQYGGPESSTHCNFRKNVKKDSAGREIQTNTVISSHVKWMNHFRLNYVENLQTSLWKFKPLSAHRTWPVLWIIVSSVHIEPVGWAEMSCGLCASLELVWKLLIQPKQWGLKLLQQVFVHSNTLQWSLWYEGKQTNNVWKKWNINKSICWSWNLFRRWLWINLYWPCM